MARDLKTDKDQVVEELNAQMAELRAQIAEMANTLRERGEQVSKEVVAEGSAILGGVKARLGDVRDAAVNQATHLRDAAVDQAAYLRDTAYDQAAYLRDQAARQAAAARARAVDFAAQAEVAVQRNPATSMGLALGAGFLLGLAMLRRGRE